MTVVGMKLAQLQHYDAKHGRNKKLMDDIQISSFYYLSRSFFLLTATPALTTRPILMKFGV